LDFDGQEIPGRGSWYYVGFLDTEPGQQLCCHIQSYSHRQRKTYTELDDHEDGKRLFRRGFLPSDFLLLRMAAPAIFACCRSSCRIALIIKQREPYGGRLHLRSQS
jgi:hypothetical protein